VRSLCCKNFCWSLLCWYCCAALLAASTPNCNSSFCRGPARPAWDKKEMRRVKRRQLISTSSSSIKQTKKPPSFSLNVLTLHSFCKQRMLHMWGRQKLPDSQFICWKTVRVQPDPFYSIRSAVPWTQQFKARASFQNGKTFKTKGTILWEQTPCTRAACWSEMSTCVVCHEAMH